MNNKIIIAYIFLNSCSWTTFSRCIYRSESANNALHTVSPRQNQLQNAYDVLFQHLDLNIERTNKTISGHVRTVAKVLAAQLDTFAFELHSNLIIDSIVSKGTKLKIRNIMHERRAVLPQTFYQNDELDITIYYKGTPPTSGSSGFGDGFSNRVSPSWGNQITWSLSQPYGAYEWFPCKQSLQDKLDSVWVFVTTDSSNRVGSNGVLANTVLLPNGKKRYEWKTKYPINYYLISVAVGQYVEYVQYAKPRGFSDSILVLNYIYHNPQTLPNFKRYIDSTAQMLELFSELFGLYPFASEKYGHVMAPFSGGMEHQTMSTMGFFSHSLVAHELAHQWFGDNVTCSTWSDIFINEGFASYAEYLAKEFLVAKSNAQANMWEVHQDVMSQNGGSIWFTDTSDARIFDARLSYNKGAAVIHSLRYEVNNDSLFFRALRNFQAQYRFGNASITDFKEVLETTTGINFTPFFDQWIYGEGYPIFEVRWNSNGTHLLLKTVQTTSASTTLFITPLDYLVKRNGMADTVLRLHIDQNVKDIYIPLQGTITSISLDPDNWILNKVKSITKDTTLKWSGVSGVEDESANTTRYYVYPNPATSDIFIDANEHPFEVMIYDIAGKWVKSEKVEMGQRLNISSLPPSVYQGIVYFNGMRKGYFNLLKQ